MIMMRLRKMLGVESCVQKCERPRGSSNLSQGEFWGFLLEREANEATGYTLFRVRCRGWGRI